MRGERLNEYLFTSVETIGNDPRTVFLVLLSSKSQETFFTIETSLKR